MSNFKALRQHCQQLNESSSELISGKKQYVIINNKLMKRSIDGSLLLVNSSRGPQANLVKQSGDPSSSSSGISQSAIDNGDKKNQPAILSPVSTAQPKNARRGSQVAP